MKSDNQGAPELRVAADIGGTFTDIAAILADGTILRNKVPSTPDDYGHAVVLGITELLARNGHAPEEVTVVLHGCTVATNAILEYKGARTALITTAGFRDVLEMRRIRVPRLYEPLYERSPALVPRYLRLEVTERIGAQGEVLTEMLEEDIDRAIAVLKHETVEAVAVCLLHSYANPAHERRIGERLKQELPHLFVTLSVDILPQIREYERTSTTVINSLVGPPVRSYLNSLMEQLQARQLPSRVLMMQSSGGIIDARIIADKPAQIIECGPAAGVVGAQRFGLQSRNQNIITFDMGGTTAKASLIEDGRISRTDEYEVGGGISISSRLVKGGGYALKLPVIDISEVGAGGGSIVWLDKANAIKVGPQSAGAKPGPACYPQGGNEPTVTDANVVLGILNPRALAGGTVPISYERARSAIEEKIAKPLGLTVEDAAYGIHLVATTVMTRAVKAVSTERGRDPRHFDLFAFGGNGGVHASTLAHTLGIKRIVVPPAAGIFSAIGLLLADVELTLSRSFRTPLSAPDLSEVGRLIDTLKQDVSDQLGVEPGKLSYSIAADLRYIGQAFELTVPWEESLPLDVLAATFDSEHNRQYGYGSDALIKAEIVTIRVKGALELEETKQLPASRHATADKGQPEETRRIYFGSEMGWREVPVVDRTHISAEPRQGPLLIEEFEGTTLVPPNAYVHSGDFDSVIIQLVSAGEQP